MSMPETEHTPGPRSGLQRVWHVCRSLLRTALILWVSIVVVLGFVQRKLMYQPARAITLPVAQYAYVTHLFPDAEDMEFQSSSGQTVRGWHLCQERKSAGNRPLVLLLHGNAGNRAGRIVWYELLQQLGCDVLAIDYQGYGDSTGTPTQAAVEADSLGTWDYAISTLGHRPGNIVVMGISLGGAAAVHVASTQSQADTPPAGLITVATFSSMVEVAASAWPWVPVRAILLDRYPSSDRIPRVTSPFLHLHGDADDIVDQRFGRLLYDRAPDVSGTGIPKRWVSLESTGHNDVLQRSGGLVPQRIEGVSPVRCRCHDGTVTFGTSISFSIRDGLDPLGDVRPG